MKVKWQCSDDFNPNVCEYSPYMCCSSCGKQYAGEQLYTFEERVKTVEVVEKEPYREKLWRFIHNRKIRYIFKITNSEDGTTVFIEEDSCAIQTVWAGNAMDMVLDYEEIANQGYQLFSLGLKGTDKGYIFIDNKTGEKMCISIEECKIRGFIKTY